jgi:hypothetical protein
MHRPITLHKEEGGIFSGVTKMEERGGDGVKGKVKSEEKDH